jgi:6,7-dimethyl-8-ribityllumazine synthase
MPEPTVTVRMKEDVNLSAHLRGAVHVFPDFVKTKTKEEPNTMTIKPNFAAERVAFIQANWHAGIVAEGRKTFIEDMKAAGFPENNIDIYDVPGSLEIPLQAKLLAESGKYDAILCGGFIINGGIYHHEYVNHAVIDAIVQVGLETRVPVLSMVLTPLNFHQSDAHHQFFFEHFKEKGRELAAACLQTLANMRGLKSQRIAA